MADNKEVKSLLDAGVHFGHLTRKWNPNMAPYIYMERNGIHIINLYKTSAKLEEANEALKKIAASGRKILFVATKKQAKDIVSEKASDAKMPYITERWPGGMLTNFVTIRRAVKKMASIDRMKQDGTFNTLSKKERLQVDRLRAKLEKNLGSISDMSRLPGALFVVDTTREHIAVKEAQKLNIPIFAMVDTNSDPREIDYAIPSNDDASKSIEKIVGKVSEAIIEGLAERKAGKEKSEEEKAAKKAKKEAKKEEEAKEKNADKKEVPSKDKEDKKAMKEAKKPTKLESKEETLEKADAKKEKTSDAKAKKKAAKEEE
ncbi:30S ribosomal protein S2 [Marixanthomonas ophiurae]|uniref:Small ribosomal subunit protein uS2 n=1 Tax=Marixanthomonas ophiurae TaxID=387659 RepID=A0A3E1QBT4_9FLAO|nr:30S ribosomal protein S2 [Marixanthomonas ophiurae]RFN59554.1 30S ribosomal protein S2 [Marixanthomonas ophiurae]